MQAVVLVVIEGVIVLVLGSDGKSIEGGRIQQSQLTISGAEPKASFAFLLGITMVACSCDLLGFLHAGAM
jgi:hypothetical protein